MTKDLFCPMIHGGLNINLKKSQDLIEYNQCCLSSMPFETITTGENFWQSKNLTELRKSNDLNQWNTGCWECQRNEAAGGSSFRLDMIKKLGVHRNLTGPQRIDLLFDRSCNLACRTCGPESSTFWQQHLKENNVSNVRLNNTTNFEEILRILKSIDLSNVEVIQFCGGETLMGNTYWRTAEAIAELIPNAKEKVTLGFQTNGTQTIDQRQFDIIEKFHLVKILVSLDGIGEHFNYMRWPADWNQVTDNILTLREQLPVNVMFIVQETLSSLNLFYCDEVTTWVKNNFSTNRLGDPTDYARQLAMHNHLNVNNITEKYYNAMVNKGLQNLIRPNWQENPVSIKLMLREIEKYDSFRNQNWQQVFPEVADFYSDYLR